MDWFRMLAKAATPQVEISVAGSKWTILQTGLRDNSTTFELGVEMDHETTDGRKTKVHSLFNSIQFNPLSAIITILLRNIERVFNG